MVCMLVCVNVCVHACMVQSAKSLHVLYVCEHGCVHFNACVMSVCLCVLICLCVCVRVRVRVCLLTRDT